MTYTTAEPITYTLYGREGGNGPSHESLIAWNKEHGDLVARAENSGSEACYVEIARWNPRELQYQRYAFVKVFGGEYDLGVESCFATAKLIANDINNVDSWAAYSPLIHRLPNFTE